MNVTFTDHIRTISRGIAPSLLSPGGMEQLTELCSLLPYDLSCNFGLETRLGNPEPACDIAFQILKGSPGSAILAGRSSYASLPEKLAGNPVWKNLCLLVRNWEGSEEPWSSIQSFWLEFDHGDPGYNPVPNIFFGIRNEGAGKRSGWQPLHQILDEVYGILAGAPLPGHLVPALERAVRMLPAGAMVYQFGLMIPRSGEALRLVITGLGKGDISGYLNSVGWEGETEVVGALAVKFQGMFDRIVYNLNIGSTVMPFLGMELYLGNMSQPKHDPRWKGLFDTLESEGLLLPEKRDALLHFCGKRSAGHFYPVKYLCGINHLKYIYRKGSSGELKAYFGAMIRPDTGNT